MRKKINELGFQMRNKLFFERKYLIIAFFSNIEYFFIMLVTIELRIIFIHEIKTLTVVVVKKKD